MGGVVFRLLCERPLAHPPIKGLVILYTIWARRNIAVFWGSVFPFRRKVQGSGKPFEPGNDDEIKCRARISILRSTGNIQLERRGHTHLDNIPPPQYHFQHEADIQWCHPRCPIPRQLQKRHRQ